MKISHTGKILFFSFLCIWFIAQTSANYVHPQLLSKRISEYIEQNYDSGDQLAIYKSVKHKLAEKTSGLTFGERKNRFFLKELMFYNNQNIQNILQNTFSRDSIHRLSLSWKQEEIKRMQDISQKIQKRNSLKIGIIVIDSQNQFTQDGEIYRVSGTSPLSVIENRVSEILLYYPQSIYYKTDVGYVYFENAQIEKKISFGDIMGDPKKFILSGDSIYEEEGIFYTYLYDEYFPILSNYGVYVSDIEASGFEYADAVFLQLQNGKIYVTFAPVSQRITSQEVFKNYNSFTQKLIQESMGDVLATGENYEQTYTQIMSLTQEILVGKNSQEEKISAVYDWMQQNISYLEDDSIDENIIYSGLETFNSGIGVCRGQARAMYYLLQAAEVEEVQLKEGYITDINGFPTASHSWIQIVDRFFDPCFEQSYQKKLGDYDYFGISHSQFYSNKYNSDDIPENLLEEILQMKDSQLQGNIEYTTSQVYRNLRKSYIKKYLSLDINESIKLQDITRLIEVKDLYFQDGILMDATNLDRKIIEYFPVKNLSSSIESYVEVLEYDFENMIYLRIYKDGVLDSYGLK